MEEFKGLVEIQKGFFMDVIKIYFAPLVVVYQFLTVLGAMGSHMVESLTTDSDEYMKRQEMLFEIEMNGEILEGEDE